MVQFAASAETLRLFDGSKGVMLQREGLLGHEAAEEWNRSHPDKVQAVYRAYLEAGSNIIQTNTFPGNRITLEKHGLGDAVYDLNHAGVQLAKEAVGGKALIAAAVGPTGEFLQPAGPLGFADAVLAFSTQLQAVTDAGADLVCFETFTDLQELRAAVIALKEISPLPFICSLSFEGAGRTLSGNPAEVCAITLQSLGATMVGANCSGGPDSLIEPINRMAAVASVPLCVKPNAGLPQMVNGVCVYAEQPADFNAYIENYIQQGVRLIGGCCGATPAHIAAMDRYLSTLTVAAPHYQVNNKLCSAYQTADPANLQRLAVAPFRQALLAGDTADFVDELFDQEADALLLDFGTVSWQGLDVWELLSNLCLSVKTPLALQGTDMQLCQQFLRYYPGRAGLVAGENPQLQALAKKYGALCL